MSITMNKCVTFGIKILKLCYLNGGNMVIETELNEEMAKHLGHEKHYKSVEITHVAVT